MDYLNYSVAVPEELELKLGFLEVYKRSQNENILQEEFMIRKALETTKDSRREYYKEGQL